MYLGYIFRFEAIHHEDEQPLNAFEIETQLRDIEKWCQNQSSLGPRLGALTTTDRTQWEKNRTYLVGLHLDNLKNLEIIEIKL